MKPGNNYLENHPEYRLNPKKVKQRLARLFLKSVNIKGDNLSVLLST